MSLKGKTALVTGGSRGLGRAIAVALAEAGAAVAVNYRGAEEEAQQTASMIEENGGIVSLWQCDVAKGEDVEQMIAGIIETHGGLDILINNAGITRDNLILRMKEEEYDQVMDTNLKGAFFCSKYAAKHMIRKRSGAIVNVASVSGILGNAGQCNYAAAKAGLIGLTKSLARELASRGIRVNALAPGFVETDMTKNLPDSVCEAAREQILMKRFGQPEEIARAALFLASDQSSYLTGQVLAIDGGMAI